MAVHIADPLDRRRLSPSADSNDGEEDVPEEVLLALWSVTVDVMVAVVVVIVRGNNMEEARWLLPLLPPRPRA